MEQVVRVAEERLVGVEEQHDPVMLGGGVVEVLGEQLRQLVQKVGLGDEGQDVVGVLVGEAALRATAGEGLVHAGSEHVPAAAQDRQRQ